MPFVRDIRSSYSSSLVHSSLFSRSFLVLLLHVLALSHALSHLFPCSSLLFSRSFPALSSFFPRSFSLFSCSSLRTPCSALRASYPIRCRSPCFRSFFEEKEQCTCAGKEQWIESKGEMSRQNSTTPICSQYPLYTHCTQQWEEQTPPQRDEKWSVLYKKMDCVIRLIEIATGWLQCGNRNVRGLLYWLSYAPTRMFGGRG